MHKGDVLCTLSGIDREDGRNSETFKKFRFSFSTVITEKQQEISKNVHFVEAGSHRLQTQVQDRSWKRES